MVKMVDIKYQVKLLLRIILALAVVEIIFFIGFIFVGLKYWEDSFDSTWQIGSCIKIGLCFIVIVLGIFAYIGLHEKKRNWLKPLMGFLLVIVISYVSGLAFISGSRGWKFQNTDEYGRKVGFDLSESNSLCLFRKGLLIGLTTLSSGLYAYVVIFVAWYWERAVDDSQEELQDKYEEKEV